MSDTAGKPFMDPTMLGIDPNVNLRAMFIDQMRDFAETIESSPSGPMVLMMLIPYLSMFGVQDLVKHVKDSDALVRILRDAADTVEEADDDATGVIIGYHSKGQLSLIAFNFTEGSVGTIQKPLSDPDPSPAGMIFFEEAIKKALIAAGIEQGMVPLVTSTLLLCGVSVDV